MGFSIFFEFHMKVLNDVNNLFIYIFLVIWNLSIVKEQKGIKHIYS